MQNLTVTGGVVAAVVHTYGSTGAFLVTYSVTAGTQTLSSSVTVTVR